MTDPVAEAAANLAALSVANMAAGQQPSSPFLDGIADAVHSLEAKVEHLIHPEAESVPNVTPGSPAIAGSATLLDVSGQPITSSDSVKPSESLPTETPVPASTTVSTALSASIPTSSAESDLPNVVAVASEATSGATVSAIALANEGSDHPNAPAASTSGTALESTPSADSGLTGEIPNVASGADESTTVTASVTSASGSGETSSIAASSGEQPLHVRVAAHLEAIFSMVKAHVDAVPVAAVADTSALKTHVGDILHRISNGMQVTQGELVQKLEALYRML